MAGSSLRNYNYEPEEVNRPQERHVPVVNPQKVPYSPFEKLLIGVGLIAAVVLITLNVSASVSATYAQHELSDVKQSISKAKSQTSDLQQEIGELSSSSRLNKIAAEQGLKLRENNIRTIR
ncbi:cell division protein FtsL [Lactobacillus sp. 23-2]|jgi:cell division protein FtsL|uniref:cell division protein FtsL n=1 Tax=Lactobacillus TaxID=1578 RepID=UPI002A24F551|nr:cell division protein FtsL [Lactobacillus porci]MDD6720293.1 cell division protein FtsL [Lactobacillus porci]